MSTRSPGPCVHGQPQAARGVHLLPQEKHTGILRVEFKAKKRGYADQSEKAWVTRATWRLARVGAHVELNGGKMCGKDQSEQGPQSLVRLLLLSCRLLVLFPLLKDRRFLLNQL